MTNNQYYQRISEIVDIVISPSDSVFFNQFKSMWHIPKDTKQTFIGNSLTGREKGFYVQSDSGYVLTLYGTGILGQLLMISPIVIGLIISYRLLASQRDYGILAIIIMGSYLVLNVKELALMTRTVWPVICVFISISLLEYQAHKRRVDEAKNPQQAA
ncbi:hypothetical protein [Thalassospira povalilytica]|uniref:hypothetical protein n=1 Tax=Thalassospira povalilytica TaxID=732237 RepID=UPI003AA91675